MTAEAVERLYKRISKLEDAVLDLHFTLAGLIQFMAQQKTLNYREFKMFLESFLHEYDQTAAKLQDDADEEPEED